MQVQQYVWRPSPFRCKCWSFSNLIFIYHLLKFLNHYSIINIKYIILKFIIKFIFCLNCWIICRCNGKSQCPPPCPQSRPPALQSSLEFLLLWLTACFCRTWQVQQVQQEYLTMKIFPKLLPNFYSICFNFFSTRLQKCFLG